MNSNDNIYREIIYFSSCLAFTALLIIIDKLCYYGRLDCNSNLTIAIYLLCVIFAYFSGALFVRMLHFTCLEKKSNKQNYNQLYITDKYNAFVLFFLFHNIQVSLQKVHLLNG